MADANMVSAKETLPEPGGYIHSGAFILLDGKPDPPACTDGNQSQQVCRRGCLSWFVFDQLVKVKIGDECPERERKARRNRRIRPVPVAVISVPVSSRTGLHEYGRETEPHRIMDAHSICTWAPALTEPDKPFLLTRKQMNSADVYVEVTYPATANSAGYRDGGIPHNRADVPDGTVNVPDTTLPFSGVFSRKVQRCPTTGFVLTVIASAGRGIPLQLFHLARNRWRKRIGGIGRFGVGNQPRHNPIFRKPIGAHMHVPPAIRPAFCRRWYVSKMMKTGRCGLAIATFPCRKPVRPTVDFVASKTVSHTSPPRKPRIIFIDDFYAAGQPVVGV
ncbi:hypothetical protein FQR65_LT20419 [Abscondita terminalis]|nr:hypothetical protein FQR65_LT20419 [Abscondita terminalis]